MGFTDFYFFIGQSTTKYNFLKNLAVIHNFGPTVKVDLKPEKTVLIVKKTILELIFHFRGMFINILKIINCNNNSNHKLLVF